MRQARSRYHRRTMRNAIKSLAHVLATIAIAPALASFAIRRLALGADRALEGSTELLALIPGLTGEYLRRAFLAHTLSGCDRSATVRAGTVFSRTAARIDANVYVGPGCHLGWVHLERDVLLGAGVHVPSGPALHGTADPDRPIRVIYPYSAGGVSDAVMRLLAAKMEERLGQKLIVESKPGADLLEPGTRHDLLRRVLKPRHDVLRRALWNGKTAPHHHIDVNPLFFCSRDVGEYRNACRARDRDDAKLFRVDL